MTHRDEKGTVWIAVEPPGRCFKCGEVTETRPAGPNGEDVCFDCSTEEGRVAYMERLMGE